jgi:hypothetical protein
MNNHQAVVRTSLKSPITRTLAHHANAKAANDNCASGRVDQGILEASLRYFAKHGLSAADEARQQAEKCAASGEIAKFQYWLGICRMLDRRMAARLARQYEAAKAAPAA